jgi:hypothetical protein
MRKNWENRNETERAKYIGRKKTLQNPTAMEDGKEMTNSVGSGLDPIMSLRFEIKIKKGSVLLCNNYACCDAGRKQQEIARKYKSFSNVERLSTWHGPQPGAKQKSGHKRRKLKSRIRHACEHCFTMPSEKLSSIFRTIRAAKPVVSELSGDIL